MNSLPHKEFQPAAAPESLAPVARFSAVASAVIVNRTHRVIRERAKSIEARKKAFRSLWIPLAISGGLLIVLICAVWSILDQYELTPTGLPDANQQMLVLMLWCLPLSAVLLAVVWFRRGGSAGFKADNENNAR